MEPNLLALDLENATNELLEGSEINLDSIEKVLVRRAAVLARIASADPASFTQSELDTLHASLRKGDSALEKLTLLRRATASEWQRLNGLRRPPAAGESTVSFTG